MAAWTDGSPILPPGEMSPGAAAPETPVAGGKGAGIVARLLHGTGAGVVAYGLGIGSNLILLPLYLRFWSVAVYGEWMALYAIVSYLANLDFGVTVAAVNAATMAHARGDWPAFKRVQGTAWAASLTIAGLGIALVALPSLLFFHVERWLNLRAFSPHEARLVFFCLAISLLANIPGRQLITVYVAIGEFAKYQWLYNAFLFASFTATAVVLITGAGPVRVATVTAGMALFTIILATWLLRRRDPRLVPSIRAADWQTARALAAPTGQFGLSMLATILTLQAPVILLSRVLGGPAVALFTTTRTVANVIRGTVGLLRAPLRPEIAAVSATRSMDALGRLFRLAVSIEAIIGLSLYAVLWSSGCRLIQFWSHGRISPDPGFLHLMLISVLLEGFLLVMGITGWATNRVKALSLGQLFTAVTSLILAVALVRSFGVSAVPIGTFAPLFLIMAPVAVRDACRGTDLGFRFVVGRLLLPFAAMGLFSAVFPQWLANLDVAPEWLSASVSGLLAAAMAVLIAGGVFLTRNDRQVLRIRVRALSFKKAEAEPLVSVQ
jgi:O-antigen/teichoic acid export membrane protein